MKVKKLFEDILNEELSDTIKQKINDLQNYITQTNDKLKTDDSFTPDQKKNIIENIKRAKENIKKLKAMNESCLKENEIYTLDREVRNEMEETFEEIWNDCEENLEKFKSKIKTKGDWPVDSWEDVFKYAVSYLKQQGYKKNLSSLKESYLNETIKDEKERIDAELKDVYEQIDKLEDKISDDPDKENKEEKIKLQDLNVKLHNLRMSRKRLK
jgi:hypothetical protein